MLSNFCRFASNQMRCKNQQIFSRAVMKEIIDKSSYATLGLDDEGSPYIVPLSFGYKWSHDNEEQLPSFYFHAAKSGSKNTIISKNPNACLSLVGLNRVKPPVHGDPCSCTMIYRSVIARGVVELVQNENERNEAFGLILQHYGAPKAPLDIKSTPNAAIYKFSTQSMTAKRSEPAE